MLYNHYMKQEEFIVVSAQYFLFKFKIIYCFQITITGISVLHSHFTSALPLVSSQTLNHLRHLSPQQLHLLNLSQAPQRNEKLPSQYCTHLQKNTNITFMKHISKYTQNTVLPQMSNVYTYYLAHEKTKWYILHYIQKTYS